MTSPTSPPHRPLPPSLDHAAPHPMTLLTLTTFAAVLLLALLATTWGQQQQTE